MSGTVARALGGWRDRAVTRARERGRQAIVRAVRLTVAATAAYVVAERFFPGTKPLLAPLTALLVVQVTLYSTLRSGVERTASVVSGVFLALLFSDLFHFNAASLAALIAASILIGQLLHLRDQLLEVPISAMLVLAVGGAGGSAFGRITETLVGAAVGVLYNVVLPGPVQSRSAGEAVEAYAQNMSDLLSRMADEMVSGLSVERAEKWLSDTRTLAGRIVRADRALTYADESRKLNVRALGTMDTAPSLRSGLDALEHCTVALRGLCRAVVDQVTSTGSDDKGAYSPDEREVFAVLLRDLAAAVQAFGRLVRMEAETDSDPDDSVLATALDTVREARVRLTELLMVNPQENSERWVLNGTLLANVERVLREIDIEDRTRQREKRRKAMERRGAAVQAVDRLRASSRQAVKRPLRRPHHPHPQDTEPE